MNKPQPTGLIRQNRITPNQENKTVNIDNQGIAKKKKFKNQDSNIKVSTKTKQEVEILIKLTDHKFSYQVIESLIDNYVETVLEPDKKRAFKALSDLVK